MTISSWLLLLGGMLALAGPAPAAGPPGDLGRVTDKHVLVQVRDGKKLPTGTVIAKNTVHHARRHASHVVAPVRPFTISSRERGQLERELKSLRDRLARLRAKARPDLLADAEIYAKAITWALRYDVTLTAADAGLLKRALQRGNERAAALEAGRHPWTQRKGKVVRAFVSAVDGSVQPCGVIVPARYDPRRPTRLDVVLHGSTRPAGMSELHFLRRFDEGDGPASGAPQQDHVELHPLGRVENCYRWAGETDVFEAIEAVCRNYNIDRARIVLRGMSMGASGTWHLGLKHPDRFVALGPYHYSATGYQKSVAKIADGGAGGAFGVCLAWASCGHGPRAERV